MKDQLVQVIFHEYGKGDHETADYYRVDSMSELVYLMTHNRKPNEYACATWVNSIGESFKIVIDGLGHLEITGEDGSIW